MIQQVRPSDQQAENQANSRQHNTWTNSRANGDAQEENQQEAKWWKTKNKETDRWNIY